MYNHQNIELSGLDWCNLTTSTSFFIYGLTFTNVTVTQLRAAPFRRFEKLEELSFKKTPLEYLEYRAFFRLSNLKKLYFEDVKFTTFDDKVLHPIIKLNEIEMINCGPEKISLDNLFSGSLKLPLQYVRIQNCKLMNSINEKTFSQLGNLKQLFLKKNQITSIGPKSFDPILPTLKTLNLAWNKLESLPVVIFKNLKPMQSIQFFLTNNPWNCCEMLLMQNFVFTVGKTNAKCKYPPGYTLRNITTSRCFPTVETTTEHPMNNIMEVNSEPAISVVQREPKPNEFKLQCSATKSIILTKPSLKWNFTIADDRALTIDIEKESPSLNVLKMRSFPGARTIPNTKCIRFMKSNQTQVYTLEQRFKPQQMYQFCYMRKTVNTISPMDCISYYPKLVRADPLILMKHQAIAIGIFAWSLLISMCVGILIVMLIAQFCPDKFRKSNASSVDLFPTEEEMEAVRRLG